MDAAMELQTEIEPRRKRRSPVRKEELLEAATREFLECGYRDANLSRIIEIAGGSKRNIYKHFEDKQGLFIAVVRQFADQLAEELGETLAPVDMSLRDFLLTFATGYLASCLHPTSLAFYRLAVSETVQFPELGRSVLYDAERTAAKHLETYLAGKIADTAEARDLAELFLTMTRGELHLRSTLDPGQSFTEDQVRAHVARVVDLFLNGAPLRE